MNQQEFHQRKTVYVYPSCVAHHSCKASRQDSTARANVQSFSSIIQLVVKKLQGIGMLGKEGTQEDRCITTHLSAVHSDCDTTSPSHQTGKHYLSLFVSISIGQAQHSKQFKHYYNSDIYIVDR